MTERWLAIRPGAGPWKAGDQVTVIPVPDADAPGWYVPAGMEHCPRCGDTNYNQVRLCITCTHGDEHYQDGLYRNGWSTNG